MESAKRSLWRKISQAFARSAFWFFHFTSQGNWFKDKVYCSALFHNQKSYLAYKGLSSVVISQFAVPRYELSYEAFDETS